MIPSVLVLWQSPRKVPYMIRLQKFIADAGIASRRQAEELILQGRVTVNGNDAVLGQSIDPEVDRVMVDETGVRKMPPKLYLAMNKPKEVLCTAADAKGRRTVYDLLPELPSRVHSVGRLDFNSEGLLLFTNDGDLTRQLTHPSNGLERVYEVKIQGEVKDWVLGKLVSGVQLEDGSARALRVSRLRLARTNEWLSVTLAEGRYREVRRMFDTLGFNVLKLKRVKFGPIQLDDLNIGAVRTLTTEEILALQTGRTTPLRNPKEKKRRLSTDEQKKEAGWAVSKKPPREKKHGKLARATAGRSVVSRKANCSCAVNKKTDTCTPEYSESTPRTYTKTPKTSKLTGRSRETSNLRPATPARKPTR